MISFMVKGKVSFDDWDCGNGICSHEWYPGGFRLDDVSLPLRSSWYTTLLAITLDGGGGMEVFCPGLLIVIQAFLLLCVRSMFVIMFPRMSGILYSEPPVEPPLFQQCQMIKDQPGTFQYRVRKVL